MTAERDGRCPFCGGDAAPAFSTTDRNRGISAVRFEYRRCRSCGSHFLANVPDDLGRYYPEDYYGFPSRAEIDAAVSAELPKLRQLGIEPGGQLIEIGPGTGQFSRAARNAGFDVTAIEMDARCCEYLERVVGVRAICSSLPEQALTQLEPARAIALWHVLEHLPNPAAVLEAAAARLQPGGVLAIATPNPQSLQFRLLRSRWAHVDAPRHLFLIPYEALATRLGSLGLEPVGVTTADPAGRHWNWFGWEYALRGVPARRRSTLVTHVAARALTVLLAPLERRDLAGTAYTAVFTKPSG